MEFKLENELTKEIEDKPSLSALKLESKHIEIKNYEIL